MLSKKQQLYKNKKTKKKKCKECQKLFAPIRELQPCCSYECEIKHIDSNLNNLVAHGKSIRQKETNKIKKEFRENDKSILKDLAQTVVNKYIRLRDKNKPCISCGYIGSKRKWNAGHFRPQGANQQIRYYTLNIFIQCEQCNSYKSGNLILYRKALIKKFGIKWVEKLESNQERGNYTVEYLQRLIKVFRKKIKLYERKFRS